MALKLDHNTVQHNLVAHSDQQAMLIRVQAQVVVAKSNVYTIINKLLFFIQIYIIIC